MSNARLFILCGLPFAGKTTMARALVSRFGWGYVSIDAINTERRLGLDGQPIAPQEWTETYHESFRRLHALLDAGRPIIYDAVSFTIAQRDELRVIAAEHGCQATVIYVATSAAEVRQRWLANRASQAREDVRDEDFALVVAQFEPPTEEDTVRYDTPEPVEEWIERTFHH